MNDSKISVRYAKAFFESAREKNILDELRRDMEEIVKISKIPEFQYLILTPVMKESQKRKVLDSILASDVHPLTLSLLHMVFRNGRELYIQAIARNYIEFYKKFKGIKSAKITSASPVSEISRVKIEKIIQKALHSTIELETEENKELIGGFVIRIDDQQYDASISTSLKNMKKQLLN